MTQGATAAAAEESAAAPRRRNGDHARVLSGRGWRWAIGIIVALLCLYALRVPLLRGMGHLLVVNDPPSRADLIYLLGGDVHSRPSHAARLFHQGVAPRIVIAREEKRPAARMGLMPADIDVALEILRRSGVPDSAVVVLELPGGVTSTTDEAVQLRHYLGGRGVRRVVVVTSDFHTRHARWNMRRALKGTGVEVRMAAAPDERFGPRDWWRSEQGLISYVQEYIKFVHNWVYR